jgi:hypothetical protein
MYIFIRRVALSCFIFNFFLPCFSQSFEIQSPLDIPLFLAGNFGELRSTHFHSGIDIKTKSEIGKNVYAVADGYICRVKVQAGGYGHSVYVKHPNGYTTVYAHLDKFFPELNDYVKNQQYAQRKFEIDLTIDETLFKVKAVQLIGISGNTGNSGGPHLHFEIRDKYEVPINVLKFALPIKDTIAPMFNNLFVYQGIDNKTFECQEKEIIPIYLKDGKFSVDKIIEITDNSAFGIEAYDYLNGSQNKCGLYTLDFSVDDKLYYSIKMDKVSFDEAAYVKTFMDYGEKILNGSSVHRMFIETNNKLSIYNPTFNNGLVCIDDTLVHSAKIVGTDVYGNRSELMFTMQNKHRKEPFPKLLAKSTYIYCNSKNEFTDSSLTFIIPPGSLFADKTMMYKHYPSKPGFYSEIFGLGDELIPVKLSPSLSIKLNKPIKIDDYSKLVIVKIDTTGKTTSKGGKFSKGWITASVSGFGKYSVAADTTNPEIKSTKFMQDGWYKDSDVMSFKITDDLAGIQSYNGYIDNSWALFEYDAKSDSLFYKIDSERISKQNEPHILKIIVADERNNSGVFTGKFHY